MTRSLSICLLLASLLLLPLGCSSQDDSTDKSQNKQSSQQTAPSQQDTVDQAKKKVQETTEAVKEKAQKTAAAAKEKVAETVAATQEKAAEVKEATQKQVAKVQEKATQMVASGKDSLQKGISGLTGGKQQKLVGALLQQPADQGKQIYAQNCSGCHAYGSMGAPKIGTTAAWQKRLEQGQQTLVKQVLNGYGQMPPKGGNASLSEQEVIKAVGYMLRQSQ